MRYVPSREASRILGVHPQTLRKWASDGSISEPVIVSNNLYVALLVRRIMLSDLFLKKSGKFIIDAASWFSISET